MVVVIDILCIVMRQISSSLDKETAPRIRQVFLHSSGGSPVKPFTQFNQITGFESSSTTFAVAMEKDRNHVYYTAGGFPHSRPILRGDQARKTFESIPVVDVSNISSPDFAARQAVAAEVGKAAEEVGFFYALNPPVSTRKMGMCMTDVHSS